MHTIDNLDKVKKSELTPEDRRDMRKYARGFKNV